MIVGNDNYLLEILRDEGLMRIVFSSLLKH